jgi:hypothetical protein
MLAGCETEPDDPTYTVWTFTLSYSEYSQSFPAVTDGKYGRMDITTSEFNSLSRPNQNRRNWTKDQIYNWFIGIGFSSTLANQETAWLIYTIDHEYDNEINNYVYNGVWDSAILPYYYNDKIFKIGLSNVYFNVPYDKKYTYFTVSVNIYEENISINNIQINSCEIMIDDYVIIFENKDIKNNVYQYQSHSANNINMKHYQIIFSKSVTTKEFNKKIKDKVKKSENPLFVWVKIDLNYDENDVPINWVNMMRLNTRFVCTWYTPANLWGWRE